MSTTNKTTSQQPLLEVQGLKTYFYTEDGVVQAINGVDFTIHPGEVMGLVGESGSGKSVTSLSIMRLLPSSGKIVEGKVLLDGKDLIALPEEKMVKLRGDEISMIFQQPASCLNPVFRIGDQIAETIIAHQGGAKPAAMAQAETLLTRVEIKNPAAILRAYPHQLSGGMLQRAMIAMALSCRPQILIADEPTTALDVTVQAQILQLIKALQAELGMGLIMITHDLGVIAETVDRVVVMYGGKVMEQGPVAAIFDAPRHPYTVALLGSMPGAEPGRRRLVEIPGASPNPAQPPPGCPFHPRCPQADARCAAEMPPFAAIAPGRDAACWRLQ